MSGVGFHDVINLKDNVKLATDVASDGSIEYSYIIEQYLKN